MNDEQIGTTADCLIHELARERDELKRRVEEMTPTAPDEDWLDTDRLALHASGVDESITLEEVREALAKIPGSLTADFIAERDECTDGVLVTAADRERLSVINPEEA